MYYLPGGKFQSWAPQSGRRGHRRDERTVSWSGNTLIKMQFSKLFIGFVKVHRNGYVFFHIELRQLSFNNFPKGLTEEISSSSPADFQKRGGCQQSEESDA